MSWLDKIRNVKLSITHKVAGEKELHDIEYKPLWVNARRVREFNTAIFEFPGVDGSLVHRGLPRGRRYNIELIFQGADHLVHAENFEESSKSRYAWRITHPLYGQLYVQPLILEYDNRVMNVTRITGEVMETNELEQEKVNRTRVAIDPVDTVGAMMLDTNTVAAEGYMTMVPEPKAVDVKVMKRSLGDIYNGIVGGISETTDYEGFFNAFETANAFIDEILAPPLSLAETLGGALYNTIAMVGLPARFAMSVQDRIAYLRAAFDVLRLAAEDLTLWSLKRLFELHGGVLVSSIALAAVLPQPRDYRTRTEVVAVLDELLDVYDAFLETLDDLQTLTGGTTDSYIPNPDVLVRMEALVNYTVQALDVIASGARQERVLILEEDTNVVSLAHRLYGLQPDDSTIVRLMDDNDIVGDEILGLRKGRRIIYYV